MANILLSHNGVQIRHEDRRATARLCGVVDNHSIFRLCDALDRAIGYYGYRDTQQGPTP